LAPPSSRSASLKRGILNKRRDNACQILFNILGYQKHGRHRAGTVSPEPGQISENLSGLFLLSNKRPVPIPAGSALKTPAPGKL